MDAVKTYGNIIKKNIEKRPNLALKMIKTGLSLENIRVSKFPEKNTPKSLQYLNIICLKYLMEPLNNPERSAWVNLFAPAEILHAMNIYPMFIEAFASFMAGFKCEDFFIDYCENSQITETLCSYHKTFIGAVESKVLPKPKFAVTTSMICDANINTFRHISNLYDIPCYYIDIPNEYNSESEYYVVHQLKEMVSMIEDIMGEKLDENKLKSVLKREYDSKILMRRYIKNLPYKYFPNTLTLEMYMMFTSHVFMGREESYNFYKMLAEEIETYPEKRGKRIYWVHLIPFYHDILKEYFNLSPNYQILGYDLDFDYLDDINYEEPYRGLAKKLITNQYNGDYDRKINEILKMIDLLKPDGVINFCHWGCKQSSGGVMLLKEALDERKIPFLILDGDGVDRRNSHNSQIKTRLEAFFEIIDNNYTGGNNL